MRTELKIGNIFREWPQLSETRAEDCGKGLTETIRLRLQNLLRLNTLGIPSLALCDTYKKMYGIELDISALGFEHLSDMVTSLPEVFSIHQADDVTASLFPDYPQDFILHDARYGPKLQETKLFEPEAFQRPDPNIKIYEAWLNRDDDFPDDVILDPQPYVDLILPMTSANISGSRGVHQAVIVGAANPNRLHVNIKGESFKKIDRLTTEITMYLRNSDYPVEAYSIPDELIEPNFPCLIYQPEQHFWERGSIVGRTCSKGNKILVTAVDYGVNFEVDPIYLYLIPREFFDIPKQGIAVSLMGLIPTNEKWTDGACKRLRCFSNRDYWLDLLLVNKKLKNEDFNISNGKVVALSMNQKAKSNGPPEKRHGKHGKVSKSLAKSKIDYEVIICDRNDDEMDIYIDDVLTIETYAKIDEIRASEIAHYKSELAKALVDVPRPLNTLSTMEFIDVTENSK